MARCIFAWSGVHKAQSDYTCAICGSVIPKNTVYHSYVMAEDNVVKGGDEIRYRKQECLDCEAPWYQPSDVNRLLTVGRIPRALPPESEVLEHLEHLPPMTLRYESNRAGILTWQLPSDFGKRILYTKNLTKRRVIFYELINAIATTAEATVASASSLKKSRMLGQLLYDVQIYASHNAPVSVLAEEIFADS